MASAGVPRLVVAKILNHVERGAEKRAALDLRARELQRILKRKSKSPA
jgi:hypothetical protein